MWKAICTDTKWAYLLGPVGRGVTKRARGFLLHCRGRRLSGWNLKAVFEPWISWIYGMFVPEEILEIILLVPRPQFTKEDPA